jgi:hypothetical protein
MHDLDCNWQQLISLQPRWQALSAAARDAFLAADPQGPSLPELIDAGFLEPKKTIPRQFKLAAGLPPVQRALNSLRRHDVFAADDLPVVTRYVFEHFTSLETARLCGHGYSGVADRAARRAASVTWQESFLACGSPQDWERLLGGQYGRPWEGWSEPLFAATQRLVRQLHQTAAPVTLGELPEAFADWPLGKLAAVVHAALHDLLLFGALRREDHLPVIGLLPRVRAGLARPAPARPAPVPVSGGFGGPYVVEDMVALVGACQAAPLRLKQNRDQLFAREVKDLAGRLIPLPPLVTSILHLDSEARIELAVRGARALDLVEPVRGRRVEPQLRTTEEGRRWLAAPPRRRLASVVQPLRAMLCGRGPGADRYLFFYDAGFLSHLAISPFASTRNDEAIEKAIHDVGKLLPATPDRGLRLGELLAYASHVHNPLLETERDYRMLPEFASYLAYDPLAPRELLADAWQQQLDALVTSVLMPVGGVTLGVERTDDHAATTVQVPVTLALTPIGAYLLGFVDRLEVPEAAAPEAGEVVVQPNFEIVFLGPSPMQEARLGRVAERLAGGGPVGTLLRITRESILRAAGGGMSDDKILAILAGAGPHPLPDNVRREVTGWLARKRRLTCRRALVVTCPDPDTAARLVSVLGARRATLLGNDRVELAVPRFTPALRRKLEAEGLFVSEEE